MNINSINNNTNNQILISNNSSLKNNNLNHLTHQQNFTGFRNYYSNNIYFQNNNQSLYNNYVTTYRSQNYLTNQTNRTLSNLGGTNTNSGRSRSVCGGSCKCGNLEGGICCGKNWCSYSWKLLLFVVFCIILISIIVELVEDYKKEEISKENSKGKIPAIEKSSKTSPNFCTNDDIKNFIDKFSIEKQDNLKEKDCIKFKSKDERCITCYVKTSYGTKCILIHSDAIYEDFKISIGHYIDGGSFEFTNAYCQEINIKFNYFYIILIILFLI
jgi:hypothetical protein